MKVAHIGVGRWGKVILRNLLDFDKIEKVYIYDIRKLDLPTNEKVIICDSLDEILDREKIKNVFISTPAKEHYEVTLKCLQAGKNVFVEKPMTCNSSQIDTFEDILKNTKQILMTDHTLLYDSHIRTIKNILEEKKTDINYVDFTRSNITTNSDMNVIWDLAPHDIAIAIYLINEPVESVFCSSNTKQDTAFFILNFKSNIAVKFQLSWRYPFSRRELIIGHNDRSIFFSEQNRKFTLLNYNNENKETAIVPSIENFNNDNPLVNAITFFLSKSESNDIEFSLSQTSFAKKIIKIIEALHVSMETNEVVKI